MKIKNIGILMLMLFTLLVGFMSPQADAYELELTDDAVVSVVDISLMADGEGDPVPVVFVADYLAETNQMPGRLVSPVTMDQLKSEKQGSLVPNIIPALAPLTLHTTIKGLRDYLPLVSYASTDDTIRI